MEFIEGGVTAARGFEAAGIEAGIKYENRKDMAIVYCAEPCRTAGVFTGNVVKAAPVLWDKEIVMHSPYAQAVVVNTGIANAGTGEKGYHYCRRTAQMTAELLGLSEDAVLVASTGVIGPQLPIDRIEAGIKKLTETKGTGIEAGNMAAEAIMTTDTKSKQAAVKIQLDGKEITIGGMCKGSGMIHPNMSTMLAFLTTDAFISKELLQDALRDVIQDTFNMISVDGDTSTNDTVLILSNGFAENKEIVSKDGDYGNFKAALLMLCEEMAKMLAGDGEGCTALLETKVIHAASREDARKLCRSVVSSNLTKAAVYGHDANWGRVLCALGYAGVNFNPDKLDIFYENENKMLLVYRDGEGVDYDEEEASDILASEKVRFLIDIKMGDAQAAAWGCDLTYDYIKINADYRS